MSITEQIKFLILISLFGFVFISGLLMVIKNYKVATPSPTNKIMLGFRIFTVVCFLLPILFLPQIRQEQKLWVFLLVSYALAAIYPLLIPSHTIEFIKQGRIGTTSSFITGVKVRFKPEYNYFGYIWNGRFVLIVLVAIIFAVIK